MASTPAGTLQRPAAGTRSRREPDHDSSPPTRPAPDRPASFFSRHGPGLLMAVATATVLGWRLGRPALWLDECATVAAGQRDWSHLWTLWQGDDAPLMTYYLVMHPVVGALRLLPGMHGHLEVLYRLPSVAVSVIAAAALISWLSRICSAAAAAATGTVLLLIGGFSRYGQEARPYATVLCLAVLATITWSTMVAGTLAPATEQRRTRVLYALTVAGAVAFNSLSAVLVAVHLLAALVAVEPGLRREAVRRTAVTAGAGLVLVSPVVVMALRHGSGATIRPPLTPSRVRGTYVHLFSSSAHPLLGVGLVVVLAAVGLTGMTSPRHRFVARLAACWALLPPVALVAADTIQPNLMLGRYVLYALPAWAVLAGLGTLTLAGLAARGARLMPGAGPALVRAVAVTTAVLVLAGVVADEAPTLSSDRAAAGHGEDPRPMLALTRRPDYSGLPIVISSTFGTVSLMAYDRHLERRLITPAVQRDGRSLWPETVPRPDRRKSLQGEGRVILLLRTSREPACMIGGRPVTAAQVERCQPRWLTDLGFRTVQIRLSGPSWVFTVLARPGRT